MNVIYSRILGRKILLTFLIFTMVFSMVALFVRHTISKKLEDVSKLTGNIAHDQLQAGHALLLLHQADEEFQESLLNADSNKFSNYKVKLSSAFIEIDKLLKERNDTSGFASDQNNQIKLWYSNKIKLSHKLYMLKHSFDSLLTVYANFQTTAMVSQEIPGININSKELIKTTVDTVRKQAEKKGFLSRLKEALKNKPNSTIVINRNNNTQVVDTKTQQIVSKNRNAYVQKLQQLQSQNVRLLNMQGQLIVLNTRIVNELEHIITDVKDNNYRISDQFKELALRKYKETTGLLNKFYLIEVSLLMVYATSLIIFIIQLNRSEVLLRKENEQSILLAQEKIDELMRQIVPHHDANSVSKKNELEEIMQLVMHNNPAFLMKFNEFDPDFIKKLLGLSPSLTATEIEFCVLLRLNFETKEIARYTKTSVRSVEGRKYRIRKKMDIPSTQDINIWMTNL